jgi:hypothetical protein
MTSHVFCGTFEAEAHWRDPQLARLPAVSALNSARIVESMDEMMFVFCKPGDSVITRRRMDDAHVGYLQTLGFSFTRNEFDMSIPEVYDGAATPLNIFHLLADDRFTAPLSKLLCQGARLEPFAVLPGAAEVARKYHLIGEYPADSVVRRVNEKSYSAEMRDRLGIENIAVKVRNVQSLLDAGTKLLGEGPFLIKDEYGVSGKGSQLIESERALYRVGKHVSAQVALGKRVSFVLEPHLCRSLDFSCQLYIDLHGDVTVSSVQALRNRGFTFAASYCASAQLLHRLTCNGYFQLMERLGRLMYADGYWGDVCVDSMLLDDEAMAPLVEINARKSMGSIKDALDRRFKVTGRRLWLTYLPTFNQSANEFCALLEALARGGLLFTARSESGVLPLTAGTIFRCGKPGHPNVGRLYLALILRSAVEPESMLVAVERVLGQSRSCVTH